MLGQDHGSGYIIFISKELLLHSKNISTTSLVVNNNIKYPGS
jgi:hypothetical protein